MTKAKTNRENDLTKRYRKVLSPARIEEALAIAQKIAEEREALTPPKKG